MTICCTWALLAAPLPTTAFLTARGATSSTASRAAPRTASTTPRASPSTSAERGLAETKTCSTAARSGA